MPRAFTEEETALIRRRLLEVGRARLDETGFRKTSVESLTRAAGISKGAFYLFFESKEALWIELLQDAEAVLRARLVTLVDEWQGSPEDALRQIFRDVFDAVTVHPLLRALADPEDMAYLLRSLPPDVFEAARRDDDAFFGRLLRRLRNKKLVRAGVPAATFAMLPRAALALAQGRGSIGDDAFDTCVRFQIEAWVGALAPIVVS